MRCASLLEAVTEKSVSSNASNKPGLRGPPGRRELPDGLTADVMQAVIEDAVLEAAADIARGPSATAEPPLDP